MKTLKEVAELALVAANRSVNCQDLAKVITATITLSAASLTTDAVELDEALAVYNTDDAMLKDVRTSQIGKLLILRASERTLRLKADAASTPLLSQLQADFSGLEPLSSVDASSLQAYISKFVDIFHSARKVIATSSDYFVAQNAELFNKLETFQIAVLKSTATIIADAFQNALDAATTTTPSLTFERAVFDSTGGGIALSAAADIGIDKLWCKLRVSDADIISEADAIKDEGERHIDGIKTRLHIISTFEADCRNK